MIRADFTTLPPRALRLPTLPTLFEPRTPFHCTKLRCSLTFGSCIARQFAMDRQGRPIHATCGQVEGESPCSEGRKNLEAAGEWRPPEYRQVPWNWRQLRVIRRGLAEQNKLALDR